MGIGMICCKGYKNAQ